MGLSSCMGLCFLGGVFCEPGVWFFSCVGVLFLGVVVCRLLLGLPSSRGLNLLVSSNSKSGCGVGDLQVLRGLCLFSP